MEQGLKIKIGADIVEVTQSLNDLKNDLKSLQDQLKNATGAEFVRLNKEIERTQEIMKTLGNVGKAGFDKFGQAIKGAGSDAGKAGYALNTLSGVVRDLPFGFIAIQNNLPLVVDAFGNLTTQSGGVKNAMKGLLGTLVGPAGIGFAFGAIISGVTALTQKYGSLGNAANALLGTTSQLSKFQKDLVEDIANETAKVETLVAIYPLLEGQRDKQDKILKQLNESAPTYFKTLSSEKTTIEQLTTANEKYIKSLLGKIFYESQQERIKTIIQEEASALVKLTDQQVKSAKQRESDANKIKNQIEQQERLAKIQAGTGRGDIGVNIGKPIIKQTFDDAVDQIVARVQSRVGDVFKGLGTLTNKLDFGGIFKDKPTGTGKTAVGQAAEDVDDLADSLRRVKEVDSGALFDKIKQLASKDARESTVIKAPGSIKAFKTPELEAQIEQTQRLKESYTDLARTFAGDLTSSVTGFVDALFSGKDAGDALLKGLINAFKNLALQLVAVVVEATILAALLEEFPALKAIFTAAAPVLEAASKLKIDKHASGGIATEATIGMVGEAGPEAIIPLSQLGYLTRQMNPQVGWSGSANGVQVSGVLVGRGGDLLAVVNSATRTANRTF